MYPILIKLGPVTIHTYGFLLAVGILVGLAVVMSQARKAGLDTRVIGDFIFYAILVGLVGARLWLFVTEIGDYLSSWSQLSSLITSGGSFYGGLIFGTLFVIWYARKYHLDIPLLGDIVMPSVALAHFFGRLGCFAAGCCWGRHAEGCSIAVKFTDTETTTGVPLGVYLYPTQLMEAILNLLNFVILFIVYKKKKFKGQVFALYIFNYSLIRFFVEYFRGDGDRKYPIGDMNTPFTSISVPQLVSLIGIVLAIILWMIFKQKYLSQQKDQPTGAVK